ncbi:MAG: LacI family DNA-binding transcriptional regulator [Gammaproteobacteria bacterium]|nr:LacI family DNA-binding transcriptional regulator [Gammaproteobacteria bacterium]
MPERSAGGKGALRRRRRTLRRDVATIHDVAARAGLSIKTVSRVVNREPRVRAETVRRVQQAIAELDYRPNFSARNLAGRRAYLIALIYDRPSDSYLVRVQEGAQYACQQLGFALVLYPVSVDSPRLIDDVLGLVRERRPTGLLLTPPVGDVAPLLDALQGAEQDYARLSAVDVLRPGPLVYVDDRAAARDLTTYLIDLGHRRIAFIRGPGAHHLASTRFEGFVEAHAGHGLDFDPRLILQGSFSFESGQECGRILLSRAERPTAIFAANDEMAAGVLHVARHLGLEVPRQISVAGFDDSPLARYLHPTLTTVRQPLRAMAELCVRHLIDDARAARHDPRPQRMLHELIVRDSTARPPP